MSVQQASSSAQRIKKIQQTATSSFDTNNQQQSTNNMSYSIVGIPLVLSNIQNKNMEELTNRQRKEETMIECTKMTNNKEKQRNGTQDGLDCEEQDIELPALKYVQVQSNIANTYEMDSFNKDAMRMSQRAQDCPMKQTFEDIIQMEKLNGVEALQIEGIGQRISKNKVIPIGDPKEKIEAEPSSEKRRSVYLSIIKWASNVKWCHLISEFVLSLLVGLIMYLFFVGLSYLGYAGTIIRLVTVAIGGIYELCTNTAQNLTDQLQKKFFEDNRLAQSQFREFIKQKLISIFLGEIMICGFQLTSSWFEDSKSLQTFRDLSIAFLFIENICVAVALEWSVTQEWHQKFNVLNGLICCSLYLTQPFVTSGTYGQSTFKWDNSAPAFLSYIVWHIQFMTNFYDKSLIWHVSTAHAWPLIGHFMGPQKDTYLNYRVATLMAHCSMAAYNINNLADKEAPQYLGFGSFYKTFMGIHFERVLSALSFILNVWAIIERKDYYLQLIVGFTFSTILTTIIMKMVKCKFKRQSQKQVPCQEEVGKSDLEKDREPNSESNIVKGPHI